MGKAKKKPMYAVVIQATSAWIERPDRDDPRFAEAEANLILRERDAIELFRRQWRDGLDPSGTYGFHNVENAKSFALLQLKRVAQQIERDLDEVQMYDGGPAERRDRAAVAAI